MATSTIFVRLPGARTSEPVTVLPTDTAVDMLLAIEKQLKVPNLIKRGFQLVIAPTDRKSGGLVSPNTPLNQLMFQPREDILELWKDPILMNVALSIRESNGNNIRDRRLVPIDFSSALINMIPTMKRCFNLSDDIEFSFQYTKVKEASGVPADARWLNSQFSLAELDVSAEGCLLCSPLSKLYKTPEHYIPNAEGRGWLQKRSYKNGRVTAKQKRFFVLKDSFLYYYRKEKESMPAGVIPLEYYTVTLKKVQKKYSFLLNVSYQRFVTLTPQYKLQADNRASLDEWFNAIKKQCVNSGNKKIFGVSLREVVARKSTDSPFMPNIIRECIQDLRESGLKTVGIFRISPSASFTEYYKNQFDSGADVALAESNDPHISAAMLKLYLRELPEPLFTFELFDKFIAAGNLSQGKEERLSSILAEFPELNYVVTKELLLFLNSVAKEEDSNKMGAKNLAVVFGPNILRSEEQGVAAMENFNTINEIVTLLIQKVEEICQGAETVQPKLAQAYARSKTKIRAGSVLGNPNAWGRRAIPQARRTSDPKKVNNNSNNNNSMKNTALGERRTRHSKSFSSVAPKGGVPIMPICPPRNSSPAAVLPNNNNNNRSSNNGRSGPVLSQLKSLKEQLEKEKEARIALEKKLTDALNRIAILESKLT